eukprot:tig00021432_g21199.t1
MQRLFGTKKPAAPAPDLGAVTDKVEGRADALNQKIAALDKELLECKTKLAQTKPGPAQTGIKSRAMQLLRTKKMMEAQRDQLSSQAFNMGAVRFAHENAKFAVEQVAAMKQGAADLKAGMKNLNLGKVENLQDELEDLLLDSEEVQDVLSRPYNLPSSVDEADLEPFRPVPTPPLSVGSVDVTEGESSRRKVPTPPLSIGSVDVTEGESSRRKELAGLEEELLTAEAPTTAGLPSYLRPAQASAPPAPEEAAAYALPDVPSRLPLPSR